jgi:hypothetical protein
MTLNPYEPPQTIDSPVPMANPVEIIPAEWQVLAHGTAHCEAAGRFYLLGVGAGLLAFVLRMLIYQGYRDDPRQILLLLLCIVFSAVMFGWGMLRNLTGILKLREQPNDPSLRRIYTFCLHLCWLKLPLMILAFSLIGRLTFGHLLILEWLIEKGPIAAVILVWWLTILWQTRGVNRVVYILGVEHPRYTSMLYWMTGTLMIIASMITLCAIDHPNKSRWLLVPIGFIVAHVAAFKRTYRQLSKALRTGGLSC